MEMNWGTKVTATTKCPECGNDFSRETYLESITGCTGLEICPTCFNSHLDENGNFTVIQ